ncbi:polyamine aminopropyltransferase [Marinimicrobium alkaliphilum]|uniref:spermidine synthase n=1 Tax=Marinimicrobium alkaliphilum TaxID=2202654 RepID=UPI000DB9D217|nr:spermidine synthase [Marinimicrobium alkaliphilum]
MAKLFEELDSRDTPIGEISLRRRVIPALGATPIYEVKLGEEFLMSSLFVAAEEALAEQGLAACNGDALDVVVGGLGLGHTAVAALQDARVQRVKVVELLAPVIDWHQRHWVPLGKTLSDDPRCEFINGSFFELAVSDFDSQEPGHQYDAILLDIDHSPRAFLHTGNAGFYVPDNLVAMARQLKPGGVFAMWSQDLPEPEFVALLEQVFPSVSTEIVYFDNPFRQARESNCLYIARTHG